MLPGIKEVEVQFAEKERKTTLICGPLGAALSAAVSKLSSADYIAIDVRDDCHCNRSTLVIASLDCVIVSAVKPLDFPSTVKAFYSLLIDSSPTKVVYNTASSLLANLLGPSKSRVVKGSSSSFTDLTLSELWRNLALQVSAIPILPILSIPSVSTALRGSSDIPSALNELSVRISNVSHLSSSSPDASAMRLNMSIAQASWMTLKLFYSLLDRNYLSFPLCRWTIIPPRIYCNSKSGCAIRISSFQEACQHIDSGHKLSSTIPQIAVKVVKTFHPFTLLNTPCKSLVLAGAFANHVLNCQMCQVKTPEKIDSCSFCFLPLITNTGMGSCSCRKKTVKSEPSPKTPSSRTTDKQSRPVSSNQVTSSFLETPKQEPRYPTPLNTPSSSSFVCVFCSDESTSPCQSVDDLFSNHLSPILQKLPSIMGFTSFTCDKCHSLFNDLSSFISHPCRLPFNSSSCIMCKCIACGVVIPASYSADHVSMCKCWAPEAIASPSPRLLDRKRLSSVTTPVKEIEEKKEKVVESSSSDSSDSSVYDSSSYDSSSSTDSSSSESDVSSDEEEIVEVKEDRFQCGFCSQSFDHSIRALVGHAEQNHQRQMFVSLMQVPGFPPLDRNSPIRFSKSNTIKCTLCNIPKHRKNLPSNPRLPSERSQFEKTYPAVMHLIKYHPEFSFEGTPPLVFSCKCSCGQLLHSVEEAKGHLQSCSILTVLQAKEAPATPKEKVKKKKEPKLSQCVFCKQDFPQFSLHDHVIKHHPEKVVETAASPAVCVPQIIMKFLGVRVDRPHSAKKFNCSLCSMTNQSIANIVKHFMSHNDPSGFISLAGVESKYVCTLCEFSFKDNSEEDIINHFKEFHRISQA
ncbi:hypothetical protein GEMRC1_002060 [Eukaryota sp. GEM-RC1]